MEELNIDKVLKDQFNPVKDIQLDIYKKYPKQDSVESPNFILPSTGTENFMGGVAMGEVKRKPSFSREVPITEAYDLVGDRWMRKFPTYKQGSDNAEYAAQNQSGWEQTVNGLSKATLNIGSVIAGNTAGFVYGLGDWARTGNFSSVYDNSFSKTLDDWNTKLGYQLPNYYTKQEKQAGFFDSVGSANFWANDVANGLSFTLGTIASEAIWAYATGGASLASRMGQWGAKVGQGARGILGAARVGEEVASAGRFGKALLGTEKVAEGLAGYKGFVYEALDNAVSAGKMSKGLANGLAKTGEILNTTRFIGTSSGNEAGIEAFHFKKEATENFYRNFEELNGRPPTAEESAEMLDKIDGAANNVFASNMAILGVSNLAMLGGMFNLKSPISGLQKSVNQKLFGIGVEKAAGETGELVFKGLERKAWQKGAGLLYKATSPLVREGMFEEGLQGATTKTANNWIERQYDPKYLNKVASLSDDAWKALGEQYGTKAGWKEIGIGGLVGIAGGVVTGEFSQFSDMAKEQKEIVAKGLNSANVTMKTFVSDINAGRMMTMAKVMEAGDRAEQAMTKRDVVSAKLAHNDSMIALAEMYNNPLYGAGGLKQMEKHGYNMIDTTEATEQEKEELKAGFKTFIGEYKSADNFANSIIGNQGRVYGTAFQARDIQKALTYTILQGQSSKKMMDESLNSLQSHMNSDLIDAIKRNDDLGALGADKKRLVRNLSQQYRNWTKKSEQVQKQVQVLQASPNEVEGNKQSRLVEMQQKLVEIENSKQEIRTELEGIGREVVQNKKMQQSFGQDVSSIPMVDDFITVDSLIDLESKLDELENSYSILKEVNPISAQAVEESMANYKKAQKSLLDHNSAIKLIASGKFKPQLADTNPFSGIYKKFAKGEEKADEHTSQFLKRLNEIRNSYAESVLKEGQEKSVESYQKAIDEIKAKETLTEEDTAKIAELETKIQALQKPVEKVKDDTPSRESANVKKLETLKTKLSDLEERLKNTPETIAVTNQANIQAIYDKLDKKLIELKKNNPSLTAQELDSMTLTTLTNAEREVLQNSYLDSRQQETPLLDRLSNLPIADEESYNKTMEIINNIDFSNEDSITEGISELANSVSGKNISATTQTPESYVRGKEKLIGNDNYRTKEYLEAYVNIIYRDFTEQGNFFNKPTVSIGKPTITKVEEGDLYEFRTATGLIGGVMVTPTEFRIDGISANEVGKGKGTEMFESLISYLREKGVTTITTKSAGEGAKKMHQKAISKGLISKVSEDGRNATFNINGVTSIKKDNSSEIKEIQKEISSLKREINKLNPQKELTVVEKLKARIEDILKLFKTSFVGTQDVEEALKKKPSNKDIEKYRELKQDKLIQDYELTGQLPIDTSLVEEFEALKEKLSQWRVYDSLAEDNQSVADLLDIVAQLETEVEQQNIVADTVIEDIFGNKEDFVGVGQQKEYSLSVNTNFPATIHINKNNTVDITHQYASSVLSRMNATNITVNSKPLSFDKINKQKVGTIIDFNSDGVARRITIGGSRRIIMSQDDFRAIPNVKFISVSSWTYPVLYERDGNGEWSPIKSDFSEDVFGDVNELEKNDSVELFVDVNNEFNKGLLGDKDESYQIDQVVIYIRKDGVVYGTVKALDREKSNSDIKTLREEAHKSLLAGKSGVIATTTVEYIQVGNPIVSLDESGNISQKEFSDDALKSVIATGYSMNGELFLNTNLKQEDVRKTLLKKATENNKDKKVPIVIIERRKQKIAFPISLIKTNVDKTEELYNILNNKNLTDAQKVTGINNVLINNSISPKEFDLIELNEEKVSAIENRLAENQEFILADQLADKKYKLENLKKDATIALDLENLFVSLPSQKFNINLENINYENLPAVKVEKSKTSIKKEVIEDTTLISNIEEIAQTIVDKIKEPGKMQVDRINSVSFESIDFSGKPVTYYKKGNKWGYLDSSNNFESLVPRAQDKIESDYKVQKELQKAKKDTQC